MRKTLQKKPLGKRCFAKSICVHTPVVLIADNDEKSDANAEASEQNGYGRKLLTALPAHRQQNVVVGAVLVQVGAVDKDEHGAGQNADHYLNTHLNQYLAFL